MFTFLHQWPSLNISIITSSYFIRNWAFRPFIDMLISLFTRSLTPIICHGHAKRDNCISLFFLHSFADHQFVIFCVASSIFQGIILPRETFTKYSMHHVPTLQKLIQLSFIHKTKTMHFKYKTIKLIPNMPKITKFGMNLASQLKTKTLWRGKVKKTFSPLFGPNQILGKL